VNLGHHSNVTFGRVRRARLGRQKTWSAGLWVPCQRNKSVNKGKALGSTKSTVAALREKKGNNLMATPYQEGSGMQRVEARKRL